MRSITLTAGSVTHWSPAPIAWRYMVVVAPGVTAGTRIVAIGSGQITLSQAASVDGPVTARFGAVVDAQDPGSIGGDALQGLANQNLPASLPPVTVSYDDPPRTMRTYDTLQNLRIGDGGTTITVPGIWQNTKDVTTDLPAANLTVTQSNPEAGFPSARSSRCGWALTT